MTLPRLLRRYVYSLPILLVAIAALSSGCTWGGTLIDAGQTKIS
jgi:hypothetical protein